MEAIGHDGDVVSPGLAEVEISNVLLNLEFLITLMSVKICLNFEH